MPLCNRMLIQEGTFPWKIFGSNKSGRMEKKTIKIISGQWEALSDTISEINYCTLRSFGLNCSTEVMNDKIEHFTASTRKIFDNTGS